MQAWQRNSILVSASCVALVVCVSLSINGLRVSKPNTQHAVAYESTEADAQAVTVFEFGATENQRTQEVTSAMEAIQAEVATSAGPAWSGNYYSGDGLGMNLVLSIAPQAGIAYQWHGCLGLYEQNLGSLSVSDSEITPLWKYRDEQQLHNVTQYIQVQWGKDYFLVPKQNLLDFCVAARTNRHSGLALRKQTGNGNMQAPTGELILPTAYEKYREMEHMIATVTAVDSPREVKTAEATGLEQTVTLDLGQNAGLVEHMRLYSMQDTPGGNSIEIDSVSESTSLARYRWLQEANSPVSGLAVGQKFTTDWLTGLQSLSGLQEQ